MMKRHSRSRSSPWPASTAEMAIGSTRAAGVKPRLPTEPTNQPTLDPVGPQAPPARATVSACRGPAASRAGPARGLRVQARSRQAVPFYAAAVVPFYAAVDRWRHGRLHGEPAAPVGSRRRNLLADPRAGDHRSQDVPAGPDRPREEREVQILECLVRGVSRIEKMVPEIYVGLDPRLFPAAGRSVFSHLVKLVEEGRATADGANSIDTEYSVG